MNDKSRPFRRRTFRAVLFASLVALLTAVGVRATENDWRTASREPVGLAPDAALVKDAALT